MQSVHFSSDVIQYCLTSSGTMAKMGRFLTPLGASICTYHFKTNKCPPPPAFVNICSICSGGPKLLWWEGGWGQYSPQSVSSLIAFWVTQFEGTNDILGVINILTRFQPSLFLLFHLVFSQPISFKDLSCLPEYNDGR